MNGISTLPGNCQPYQLWERLTQELSSILDAHGVCAAVALEVAVFAQTTTVVAMHDRLKQLYDVWICQPDGKTEQTRWRNLNMTLDGLVSAGTVRYLEKFRVPAREQLKSELWYLPKEALLAVPLPYPNSGSNLTPSGLLCLVDPAPTCSLDAPALQNLAQHITIFLDRAYLRHHVDRQEIVFTVISEINQGFTTKLELGHIYRHLSDQVRRALNVQTISIGLSDPITQEIVFVGELMGPLFQELPPIRLKRGEGIAGYVAENRTPEIVNDAYADRRFFSRVDAISGFATHSILCVPLIVEDRVIGVFEALNKRDGDFNRQDIVLMQAISSPLAAAIENARLHEAVLAEKRRIETMFESMAEGILVANQEGWITIINEALTSLVGLEEAELVGKQAKKVIRTRAGNFTEFMEYVLQKNEVYPQLACDIQKADNSFVPVLVSGTGITDDAGNIKEAIFVFSDLRQIREFERMRDDFFHNIVHELRTPLATILMYARLLREGKTRDDPEKTDRFLTFIIRESDRLQQMVRDMLQLAKLEAREIQRGSALVNLNRLFEEILPPLADRATEKGLTFSERIQAKLPPIYGNEEMLYIIFKNLIENAIKFTPAGSVRVNARFTGQEMVIRVADEGIGIPKEALPNLFKRFYRTSTAVERGIAGTGLGLYMIKECVEKHHGNILVESKEGKGTTFTVKLPIANL